MVTITLREMTQRYVLLYIYREFSLVATKILPWNILYLPGRTYLSQLVLWTKSPSQHCQVYIALCYYKLDYYDVALEILQTCAETDRKSTACWRWSFLELDVFSRGNQGILTMRHFICMYLWNCINPYHQCFKARSWGKKAPSLAGLPSVHDVTHFHVGVYWYVLL